MRHFLAATSMVVQLLRGKSSSVPAKDSTLREGDTGDDDNTIASTTTPKTELEQWLNVNDDEYDEGTVVVIGRPNSLPVK